MKLCETALLTRCIQLDELEHLPCQIMHHSNFASSHNSAVDDEKVALMNIIGTELVDR